MRPALWLVLAAAAAIARADAGEPWVEMEDLEGDLENDYHEVPQREPQERQRRDAYVEQPYEEHIRVKRRCHDEPVHRVQRSAEYTRVPRQVHQYEVHEFTEEDGPPSPPYEEMLAASANHYHRVVVAPDARSARYFDPVSASVNANPTAQYASVNVVSPGPVRPVALAKAPENTLYAQQGFAPVTNANAASVSVHAPETPASVPASHGAVQFVASANVANVLSASDPERASAAVAGPSPVASDPAVPLQRLAGGDLLSAAAGHKHAHKPRNHGHSAGGGHKHHAGHHAQHGGKSTKGYESAHHVDKGAKGFKKDENHRKEYEEAAGKKHKHHDHAGHKGSHEEEAHGSRGGHFDEKKGHKKGHKTKGYHNKYHKDEFHKEHKFYDDYHKSGEHHRYGKFHAKHASNESGKKKAHHVDAGHDVVERGKKGYSNKGHLDADHKGYKAKHGHEEHHEKHSDQGKKGGSEGGKSWGYAKKG